MYLALNHSHPFSSVLRRSQFGPFVPCLDIYSVLNYLRTTSFISKVSAVTFSQSKVNIILNSETKVDLLRVTETQFRIKVTCRQQIKILSCWFNGRLPCFKADVLVRKVCIYLFVVLIMTLFMQKPVQHWIPICIQPQPA